MICARCNRTLRRPGTDIVIGGVPFVFGPVCAAKLSSKRKRSDSASRRATAARRADQRDLFVEAGL